MLTKDFVAKSSEIKSRRDKLAQPSVRGTFQWRIDVSGLCNMVKKRWQVAQELWKLSMGQISVHLFHALAVMAAL